MYHFTAMCENTPVAVVEVSDDKLSPEALVMVAGSSIGTQKILYLISQDWISKII
jgi:hypothetical protein